MSMHRFWLLVIAAGVACLVGPPATPAPPSRCIRSLEVRPRLMFRLRSYDIEARIRIEPHADHRAFSLAYTSDVGAEGRELRELNDLAAVTQDPIWIKRTPGGHYVFSLAVFGRGGRLLERRTADIAAVGDEATR